jgi:hypothetical protein
MPRAALAIILSTALLPAISTHARAEPPKLRTTLDAPALARKIDEHIAARWKAKAAKPAPLADDAEFMRRAYLDLIGRIPDLLEARDFLDNKASDKRGKLIDKLLENERYPAHFANVWRALLLPDANNPQVLYTQPALEVWLRKEFKDNSSFDRIARAVVTGGLERPDNGLLAFYQANGYQPPNLAAATSRLFLGVKLECAQCHDHPHAKWTRKQFWQFTAFFAGVSPSNPRGFSSISEIKIPGSEKTVKARFLDGEEPKTAYSTDPRTTLMDWMTRRDNPYFSRAGANRMWEYLLGTGLVEPVDEASTDNPPSHPELLDELAFQFAAHKYDLKYLIRAIMLSKGYQLTSKASHPSQADPRLFARRKVRGLSPEQLFDSLIVATGDGQSLQSTTYVYGAIPNPNSPRQQFLRRFPNQDKRTEQQTSILQALYLMNGKLVADATSLEKNENLAIIANAKSVRTSRRIEQLYLITLSRKPRPAEVARLVKYVDKGGPSGDSARALCDVFWALLNSSEFCVNR